MGPHRKPAAVAAALGSQPITAPTVLDPAVQAAAEQARLAAGEAAGRMSTILTSGLGVTSPVSAAKKTLLGS